MLHGRSRECAAIDAVMSAARDSTSRCLVLRGEPGIGRTALLAYALAQASDLQVLSASGVPSESGLPFAGLHQLLRPALRSLDDVPAVQADALRAALGLAHGDRPDRFLRPS